MATRIGKASRGGGSLAGTAALALACLLLVAIAASAPAVAAEVTFCLPGSGAGQCDDPEGVAVNQETGTVYVADSGNDRVNVFDEDGNFIESFGSSGSGAGQFNSPSQIAVDNDPGPSHGAVYVVDYDNFRVQKFSPGGEFLWMIGGGVNSGSSGNPNLCTSAGPPSDVCGAGANGTGEGAFSRKIGTKILLGEGPGGEIYVIDSTLNGTSESEGFHSRLQRFGETGEAAAAGCLLFNDTSKERARSLAVAPTGSMWVGSETGEEALRRFDASCGAEVTIAETLPGTAVNEFSALAVDGGGAVYSVQGEKRVGFGFFRIIAHYSPAGEAVGRFGYEELATKPEGLAAGGARLYVSDGTAGVKRLGVPGARPVVPGSSVGVAVRRSVSADVRGEVNPEGLETQYWFKYVEKSSYEAEGFAAAAETEKATLGSEGFLLGEASVTIGCKPFSETALAEGKCLEPETKYVFGLFAENASGESEGEAIGELETAAKMELLASWASEVGSEGAKLRAQVNPLGSEATGRIEYVEESAFEESEFAEAVTVPSKAESPLSFGSGEAAATAGVLIGGLAEGTAYRYRVVASNPFVEGVVGPTKRFQTFEKAATERCGNDAFRLGAAALLPDCRAYEQVSPEDKGGGSIKVLRGFFSLLPAVLEQSAASGEKLAYGSVQPFAGAESAPYTSQYIAARGSGGWDTHPISPPFGDLIVKGLNAFDVEYKRFSEDLCTGWLVPFGEPPLSEAALPGFLNLYKRGDQLCGGAVAYGALTPGIEPPSVGGSAFRLELQGVSADQTKAIYKANDKIAAQGLEGVNQVYGYDAEAPGIKMLCILPGGEALSGPCTAGTAFSSTFAAGIANFTNALSEDGKRLYFTAGTSTGPIYLRTDPFGAGSTVAVSKGAEEAEGSSASRYRGATADGSRAFFTTGGGLTGGGLYEYVAASEEAVKVAGESQGILGMSGDGTRTYFLSREDLGGEAEAGAPNLYLREAGAEGGPRFIATLAAKDAENAANFQPGHHAARVSASGAQVAFMSQSPGLAAAVAGADITDAESPVACEEGGSEAAVCDAEVYLYDAEAEGGAGKLICASCNPTGARPLGAAPESGKNVSFERMAAQLATFESSFYASRALSGDGNRLYFEAADRLVARDTNGHQDVYQWERAGTGSCKAANPTYNPLSGGCVELISSGQSLVDSRFVDASPSGGDVFFTTLSSLRGTDSGLVDIYDARVGGGYPEPPPPAPGCEGEACQSPAAAPQAVAPASSLYEGQGNLRAAKKKARRCPKGKRKVKRKGNKVRCVKKRKHARRHHVRHRRGAGGR